MRRRGSIKVIAGVFWATAGCIRVVAWVYLSNMAGGIRVIAGVSTVQYVMYKNSRQPVL